MKTQEVILRRGGPGDRQELQQLYVDTITNVCAGEYNAEERRVWASGIRNAQRWTDMLANQYVLVATDGHRIVGFSTLDKGNYIDFMYVHKDHQGQGIARLLLQGIEQEALRHGTTLISSDISKTARPFFERNGYQVIREQARERDGVVLVNYKMTKALRP